MVMYLWEVVKCLALVWIASVLLKSIVDGLIVNPRRKKIAEQELKDLEKEFIAIFDGEVKKINIEEIKVDLSKDKKKSDKKTKEEK